MLLHRQYQCMIWAHGQDDDRLVVLQRGRQVGWCLIARSNSSRSARVCMQHIFAAIQDHQGGKGAPILEQSCCSVFVMPRLWLFSSLDLRCASWTRVLVRHHNHKQHMCKAGDFGRGRRQAETAITFFNCNVAVDLFPNRVLLLVDRFKLCLAG